ncbi:MAG TPA: hypothetical protein VEC16_00245 [Alphaproteobacteria bacterium]|nr:hypothetical protein [Alphaproteobacteria bacterium]
MKANKLRNNYEVARGFVFGSLWGLISGGITGSAYSLGAYSAIKRIDLPKQIENIEKTSSEKTLIFDKSFSLSWGISHNVNKYISFGASIYHGLENIIEVVQTQDASNLEYMTATGIITNIVSIAYEHSAPKKKKKIDKKINEHFQTINIYLKDISKALQSETQSSQKHL